MSTLAWVIENYDGHGEVVYGPDAATVADEHDVIEPRRAEEFDQYAPGGPSAAQLLTHGWWFECDHCGHHVEQEGCHTCGVDAEPTATGDLVWCDVQCEAAWRAHRTLEAIRRAECRARLRLAFAEFLPGATITELHPYPYDAGSVFFTFPGAQGTVRWNYGAEAVTVQRRDQDAWTAWRKSG